MPTPDPKTLTPEQRARLVCGGQWRLEAGVAAQIRQHAAFAVEAAVKAKTPAPAPTEPAGAKD